MRMIRLHRAPIVEPQPPAVEFVEEVVPLPLLDAEATFERDLGTHERFEVLDDLSVDDAHGAELEEMRRSVRRRRFGVEDHDRSRHDEAGGRYRPSASAR